MPPWRSLAATLTGDEALAREEVELAERWGTPLARGLALRGLGLVTSDEALLRRAVAELEASPNRLELARAQVELGALLRRDGRRADAREPLRDGMDGAHACGAKPLAERARTELLATGARPRRLALQGTDALTPSERRVADLAAQGPDQPPDRAGAVRDHGDRRDATCATPSASSTCRAAASWRTALDAPGVTSPVS